MKVFIGWSGTRSQALALALRDWLPLVLHYVEPWLSEKDIAAGERWADAIAKELEASNFGILCVTRENLSSPWIPFEAGSLAKSLSSSRVIPLLLDLEFSEVSGPLAQFQAKKVDEDGVGEAIQSINGAAEQPVPEGRAKQLFDALWPDFRKKLEAIPAPKDTSKPARSQHQIMEELVASVRSLESKIREISDIVSSVRFPKSRKFGRMMHPLMLSDMMEVKPDDPVSLLLVASSFRDDMPWFYELAMDVYRAVKSCNAPEIKESVERLKRAAKMLRKGPFLEEFDLDPRLYEVLLHSIDRCISSNQTTGGQSEPERPTVRKRTRTT